MRVSQPRRKFAESMRPECDHHLMRAALSLATVAICDRYVAQLTGPRQNPDSVICWRSPHSQFAHTQPDRQT